MGRSSVVHTKGRERIISVRGTLDVGANRRNRDLQLCGIEPIVAQTEGVTASFFEELLQRSHACGRAPVCARGFGSASHNSGDSFGSTTASSYTVES